MKQSREPKLPKYRDALQPVFLSLPASRLTSQTAALAHPTSHPLHHANTWLQPSLKREMLIAKVSPQDTHNTQGITSRLLPFFLHSGLAHGPWPKDPVHIPQQRKLLQGAHHHAAQPRPMLSLVLIYLLREEAENESLP